MREIRIETDRLCIVPLSIGKLKLQYENETDCDMKQAYLEMIETIQKTPDREEWGTYWEITSLIGFPVGGLCFKGAPDEYGVVEVGYGINAAYRQRGYATEAVKGIVKWALGQPGITSVCAEIEPDNEISRKVLLNCGFVRNGFGKEGPLYKIKL